MVNTSSSVLHGSVEILPHESVAVPLFVTYQHRARNSEFFMKILICVFECRPNSSRVALQNKIKIILKILTTRLAVHFNNKTHLQSERYSNHH